MDGMKYEDRQERVWAFDSLTQVDFLPNESKIIDNAAVQTLKLNRESLSCNS